MSSITTQNPFATSLIGKKLGAYQVSEVIGEGGMATVVRAENLLNPKITRALKVIKPEYAERAQFFERFSREAAVLDQLKSKYIVAFHNLQQSDDIIYMELELLKGFSLDKLKDHSRTLSALQVTKWLHQAALGLAEAHQSQIIHRDIKPANLFIHHNEKDPEGHVKILDFGIARVTAELDEARHMTLQGHVLGSPAYMAPEVCEGGGPSPQSDIYSLSLIAYEVLLGHHPFFKDPSALNTMQVMLTHLKSELPPLTEHTKEVPGLEELLRQGASRDPLKRFKNGAEMARELDVILTKVSSINSQHNKTPRHNETPKHNETPQRPLFDPQNREITAAELFGDLPRERTSVLGPLIAALLCMVAVYTLTYEWRTPRDAERVGPRTIELKARMIADEARQSQSQSSSKMLRSGSLTLDPNETQLPVDQGQEESSHDPSVSNEAQRAESLLKALNFTWISLPKAGSFESSISKTEVTVGQYRLCVEQGACEPLSKNFKPNFGECTSFLDQADLPMSCVTFDEATRFAEWVHQVHQSAYREGTLPAYKSDQISLPTEEEWGAASHGSLFPWGDQPASCRTAVFFERAPSCDGALKAKQVCSRTSGNNQNGACDLSGNLWEWIKPPVGASSSSALVMGGAWSSAAVDLRLDVKRQRLKESRDPSIGIRLIYRHDMTP